MNRKPFSGVRFRRGPDRRNGEINPSIDLRSKQERRKNGLSWILLFRNIDETIINDTIGDLEVLLLPAGSLLLKPGDKNESVYLLLSGALAANFDPSLNPGAALPIKPGECIGEFSAIDGKPVSAFVLAVQDSRVLHVLPDSFWNQLMPIPGIARNLLISLTERMRRSNEAALESHRKQLELFYLRQELDVARQLQSGMLPLQRPMFPQRANIEIAGFMEAASEIGGDLFDAFFVEEELLFVSIGDVSGHGIPAALFMARIIGLMRISAMTTTRPEQLLEYINNQLCDGNDSNMFVTLFCGFLDTRTWRFIYSNAGHCAPLLMNNGKVSRLPIPKGALVAIMPAIKYTSYEIKLSEADTLLCFTDGVTEAQTEAGEEFSEERLLAAFTANASQTLEELLEIIRCNVATFTDNKNLVDDCTMLALRRPSG